MSENVINHDPQTATHDDEEVDLLDLALVLAKRKKLLLGLPLAAAVVAVVITLLLPNIYTGTTRILPPQQSQSTTATMLGQLTNQLGGVGSLAGGALGIKNPNEMYIGMLKSRTVADNLIDRFDLKKIYDEKTYQYARKELENRTEITSAKDNIIRIEVDDRDPKRAAALANGYVEELYKLTQMLAVTEASQRRLFFERQLEQSQKLLAKAEDAARQGLEKGGLVIVDAQGRAMAETTARLRGQITVKEIQVSAMQGYAAAANPDLILVQHELEAMKRELAKIEGVTTGSKSVTVPEKGDGMENLRLLRDVKYHEVVYELLARQYEMARIDEAKDASLIQVLDKAIEPEKKSKPKRTLTVILSALAAGFIAVFWAILVESLLKMKMNPKYGDRIDRIRHYIAWR